MNITSYHPGEERDVTPSSPKRDVTLQVKTLDLVEPDAWDVLDEP